MSFSGSVIFGPSVKETSSKESKRFPARGPYGMNPGWVLFGKNLSLNQVHFNIDGK